MRTAATAIGAACLVLAASVAARALEFGEKAPEPDVTQWVQGGPVSLAAGAGKSVYVIEFLDTFTDECKSAFDAGTKLADAHAAKGLEFVAVFTESADAVKAFLAEHKGAAKVALDENHNATIEFAGDEPSLPHAVVVDKAGVVVYAGAPGETMTKLVGDVVAGKFDVKKVAEIRRLAGEVRAAVGADDRAKADLLCDQILALDPTDRFAFDSRCGGYEALKNLDGYRKFVKAHAERVKDDAGSLAHLARRLIGDWPVSWRDADLALSCARRAVEVSKERDAQVLDTYAYVLSEIGLLDEALAEAKKAQALDAANTHYASNVEFLTKRIALRAKAAGAPLK